MFYQKIHQRNHIYRDREVHKDDITYPIKISTQGKNIYNNIQYFIKRQNLTIQSEKGDRF